MGTRDCTKPWPIIKRFSDFEIFEKKKRVSMVNWQKLKIPTQHWLKYKCGWYIKVVTTTVVSLWNRIE